jgi:hypothetical protein
MAGRRQSEFWSGFFMRVAFLSRRLSDFLVIHRDEIDVSEIDEQTGALSENKDRIPSVHGVRQQRDAACQRKIPERLGNDAFLLFFRGQPLNEKTHEEQGLAKKTHAKPDMLGR